METPILLFLAFTEILHLFLFHYIEFQAPQNCSPTAMYREKVLYFEVQNRFFYHIGTYPYC